MKTGISHGLNVIDCMTEMPEIPIIKLPKCNTFPCLTGKKGGGFSQLSTRLRGITNPPPQDSDSHKHGCCGLYGPGAHLALGAQIWSNRTLTSAFDSSVCSKTPDVSTEPPFQSAPNEVCIGVLSEARAKKINNSAYQRAAENA